MWIASRPTRERERAGPSLPACCFSTLSAEHEQGRPICPWRVARAGNVATPFSRPVISRSTRSQLQLAAIHSRPHVYYYPSAPPDRPSFVSPQSSCVRQHRDERAGSGFSAARRRAGRSDATDGAFALWHSKHRHCSTNRWKCARDRFIFPALPLRVRAPVAAARSSPARPAALLLHSHRVAGRGQSPPQGA